MIQINLSIKQSKAEFVSTHHDRVGDFVLDSGARNQIADFQLIADDQLVDVHCTVETLIGVQCEEIFKGNSIDEFRRESIVDQRVGINVKIT